MRPAHPTERAVGIEHYVSDVDGTGGRLRDRPADFRVREREQFSTEPLDAPTDAYPHLVIRATLTDWDTNDFAAELSNALGMSRERISWAGTKDKRAVTTQLFSIRDVEPADLPALSGTEIDVVGRAGRSLTFGDLAGNEFEIVVSDAEAPDRATDVRDALANFGGRRTAGDTDDGGKGSTSIGVPNYFGQQRFGSYRPITHEVGLAILRGDWEGAVMAYLGNPHEAEPTDTQSAREYVVETRDWAGALDRFPGHLRYERSLLHVLSETDGEPTVATFREALARFPSNLQRLFVHAAQSYAFNEMLSERLDRGLSFDRPVEGDVVCFTDTDAPEGLVVPDPDRTQRVTGRRVDSVARHCDRGRAFVTAPLVGTGTDLAAGEQGEIERAVLEDLSLSTDDFALPDPYRSTGTRRAILVRTDLSIESAPLTLSFALPSGAYATVVLREFLKTDPVSLG
ncbi:tRNA pseudouridine(13) synthase TruD [Halovivax cerinus]|uniref:Probable tRNA pseudouridine synthase D n=1 Tax=Halovivax cerinus TaxID=1487865 RepID=A0ABD5NJQ5_9EURY|nr:tRNA pseudouridine(13) synthase TruD [Halovivax cerinus]